MKEIKFQWIRLLKTKLFFILLLFLLALSAFHYLNTSRSQNMIGYHFHDRTQNLEAQISEEKMYLLKEGSISVPFTEKMEEKYPVMRLERLLWEAFPDRSRNSRFNTVQLMMEFYDVYEKEYKEHKQRQTYSNPFAVRMTPYDDLLKEEIRVLHAQHMPYEDMDYTLNGVQFMSGMINRLVGMPFVLFATAGISLVLVVGETELNRYFRRTMPGSHWSTYFFEAIFALFLIFILYGFISGAAFLIGTFLGEGIGNFHYPVVQQGAQTIQVTALGSLLIERAVRVLPAASFIVTLLLVFRALFTDRRISVLFTIAIGSLFLQWANYIQQMQEFTMQANWMQLLVNPMTSLYATQNAPSFRLPLIAVPIITAYILSIGIGLASLLLRSRIVQDTKLPKSKKKTGIYKRSPLPNLSFSLKKQLKSPLYPMLLLLLAVLSIIVVLGEIQGYKEKYKWKVNDINSSYEMYSDNLRRGGTDPNLPRYVKTLEAIIDELDNNPHKALQKFDEFSREMRRGIATEDHYGFTQLSNQPYGLWFYAIENGNFPFSISTYIPQTVFDKPRTSKDQIFADEISERYLLDVGHLLNKAFAKKQILAASAVLLIFLATGISQEMDKKRTIDFLHIQPTRPKGIYGATLFSQSAMAIFSILLTIGLGAGVFSALGATNYTDYPIVEYVQEPGEKDITTISAKFLTRYRLDDSDVKDRSQERVGFTLETVGKQNAEMLFMLLLLITYVIATAGIVGLYTKSVWTTSIVTIGFIGIGFALVSNLYVGAAWITPFPWFDVSNIANGTSSVVLDQGKLIPKVGVLVLSGYTILMVLLGLFLYKHKFWRGERRTG